MVDTRGSGAHALDRRQFVKGAAVAGAVAGAGAAAAFADDELEAVEEDSTEEEEEEEAQESAAGTVTLLTQPFLQLPEENSVHVVWFTETTGGVAPEVNVVQLFEDGTDQECTREIEASDPVVPDRMRLDDASHVTVYRHEAVVDELPTFNGKDSEKVAYRVVSDGVASDVYTLQAATQPGVGSGIKILLTSDIQCKDMCAANIQKAYEKVGLVDAVFANGDIVDRGDAYVDWFSSDKSFFRVLQGTTEHTLSVGAKGTYYGAPLLQNAPLYAAVGNHETMGAYADVVGSGNLSTEFNNAHTRAYAEALYEQNAATVNPTGDEDVKERYIKDNSYNCDTYETVLTLPENSEGNRRYYAVTVGDVRLVVLDICRAWRTRSHSDTSHQCYNDPLGAVDALDSSRGFGQIIFEPIGEGSDQLEFLKEELASSEFQSAKYKVVMFHWQFNSLGGNVIPFYCDPVENVVTRSDGQQQVVYTYPRENDYLINYVAPLFEEYGVDLIFNAHSHLWNRFKSESGMNIIETSNIGNTYNAFLDSKTRTIEPPYAPGGSYDGKTDNDILFAPFEGHLDDYVMQGDPYGLSPQMPTNPSLVDDNPYLMSSSITAFSILDTATGTVDSYLYDTSDVDGDVLLFDSFPIVRTPDRAYDLEGSGVLCKTAEYSTGYSSTEGGVAEIVAHSAKRQYAYLVNGAACTLDIVDLSTLADVSVEDGEVATLELKERIDVSALVDDFAFGDITSVAVNDDRELVALALQAEEYSANGRILLLDLDGGYVADYIAGVQPDMICFTPDGTKVLTADEGEPREGYGDGTVDPKGSVTVLDLSAKTPASVMVPFTAWDDERDALVAKNVLLKKDLYPSTDFEPEYIAVSSDSSTAYVCLQEANAIATLDLDALEFTAVNPLGFKNHLIANNELDFDKDDKEIIIRWGNLWGVYMPDGIASLEVDGTTYLLTANEGDASEWGDYSNVKTSVIGNNPQREDVEGEVLDEDVMDGLPEQAAGAQYMLGGRSFSVYRVEEDGTLEQVFDSGSDFERIIAAELPDYFNASYKNNKLDSRSDSKGPEPEGVVVGAVGDKTYAFIGLERIGGVMMYDVTDPENPAYVDYLNTRDFTVDFPDEGTDPAQGDIGPEGLYFVTAEDSPNGYPVVLVAFEVSGTLAAYQIAEGYVAPATEDDDEDDDDSDEDDGTTDDSGTSGTDSTADSSADEDGSDTSSGTSSSSGSSSSSSSDDDTLAQTGDASAFVAAGVAALGGAGVLGGAALHHKQATAAEVQAAIDEDSDLDA